MEASTDSVLAMRKRKGLGRCRHFFWLGVAFDVVGALILFVGVFSDLIVYDLLLYLGSIIMFLSLLWWVFWYTGNIELSPEEAWKRSIRVDALSTRLSLTFNVTNAMARAQRGHRRRRLLQSAASMLSGSLSGRVSREDQELGGMKSGGKRDEAEDLDREDLRSESETVQSSEDVCPAGPDVGTLGPEAGYPSTHLVQPEFTPSPLAGPLVPAIVASSSLALTPLPSASQPLAPAIVASRSLAVTPFSSASQTIPVAIQYSGSLSPLTFRSQPLVILAASASLPGVPLPSTGQSLANLASSTQTVAPAASQCSSLVDEATQSDFQIPVASETDFQNFSLARQTQLLPAQASQAQALANQAPIQLLLAPSFQTQPVNPRRTSAFQNFQALYDAQRASTSTASVQEISLSQSSDAQKPPEGQELSQEVPDTGTPFPESLAVATEAQPSVPRDSAPAPPTQNGHL